MVETYPEESAGGEQGSSISESALVTPSQGQQTTNGSLYVTTEALPWSEMFLLEPYAKIIAGFFCAAAILHTAYHVRFPSLLFLSFHPFILSSLHPFILHTFSLSSYSPLLVPHLSSYSLLFSQLSSNFLFFHISHHILLLFKFLIVFSSYFHISHQILCLFTLFLFPQLVHITHRISPQSNTYFTKNPPSKSMIHASIFKKSGDLLWLNIFFLKLQCIEKIWKIILSS